MPCSVITFYSYKGGVGRSFALANIAVILAQWGARVLAVDWDIEAPGLNHYYSDAGRSQSAGVLDFIEDCRTGVPKPWDAYASPMALSDGTASLYLMPAMASSSVDYTERVQNLDWDELYDEHKLGERLEELRAQWVEAFDFVLVDSRTGVTDFSGLTTVQLPDVLVFMFTANVQSLAGCADIARRAMEARRKLPVDRSALVPLPIPARFEQREEYERAKQWRARFARELEPFLDRWRPPDTDLVKLVDLLTIPYVPRWTFGEDLAVLQEPAGTAGTRTSGQAVTFALETIAAILALRFSRIGLLVTSRDEYVHAARASLHGRRAASLKSANLKTGSVYCSYAEGDLSSSEWTEICDVLTAANFNVYGGRTTRAIEGADAYVILLGPSFSQGQAVEIETILRQTLRSDLRRPVIPVILPQGEKHSSSSRLADFHALKLDPTRGAMAEQLAPLLQRLSPLLEESVTPIAPFAA